MINKIELKSINELLGESFYIPSYQRGYRWTKLEVRNLLDDIWEFSKKKKDNKEFYCLQPIVVYKKNEMWEIVDGQQRLTTIRIILSHLVQNHLKRPLEDAFKKPIFQIEYQTRGQEFLDFLDNIEESDKNIDFFYIWQAYKEIDIWFNDKDYDECNDFISTILTKDDDKNPVKVIWYDLTDEILIEENAIDVFTRLNIGKIPLTNSELIKGLILQKGNFAKEIHTLKQIQIASEWDGIEKKLQDDSFWFFIYNPNDKLKYDNRIEFIFDIKSKRTVDSEFYHTFIHFKNDIENISKTTESSIDQIWMENKKNFLILEDWYNDNKTYHYVGFLVDCGIPIKSIIDAARDKSKDEFIEVYLKGEIRKQVKCNIDEIEYGDKRIKRILLLFNIQTVLETQKSDMRFPFNKYKSKDGGWDIEHVCSQTEKVITGNNRISWIDDILDYFTGTSNSIEVSRFIDNLEKTKKNKSILQICKNLLDLKTATKIGESSFNKSFGLVRKYFKEDNLDDNNDISNLALLDAVTNRSYGNAFFPVKRKRIISNDSKGIFVPIATKNLFLKYYSNKMGDVMYWNREDAKDYLIAIKRVLQEFLPS